jgi:beta-N-acetylhexosaminidase
VVFTDDLCMGAIAKRYTPAESAAMAWRAGCDLPLICHGAVEHLEAAAAAVAELPAEILETVEHRIARFRLHISTQNPMTFIEWNDYLKNVADFTASVEEVGATPGSPVQDY